MTPGEPGRCKAPPEVMTVAFKQQLTLAGRSRREKTGDREIVVAQNLQMLVYGSSAIRCHNERTHRVKRDIGRRRAGVPVALRISGIVVRH